MTEAKKTAERSKTKAMQEAQKELQELAFAATKKIVLQSGEDALDQFLSTAEKED